MSPAAQSPVVPGPRDRHPAQQLQTLFVLALGTIACTALLGPVLFQRETAAQAVTARLINLAGRQRTLSESLCRTALPLQALPPDARSERVTELRESLATCKRVHVALQTGDAELEVPVQSNPAILARLQDLNADFEPLMLAAEQVAT